MSKPIKDGGPAFPGAHLDRDVLELLRNTPANFGLQEAARLASHHGGMTLRAYFAGRAMQGIIGNSAIASATIPLKQAMTPEEVALFDTVVMPKAAARCSVAYADALIAALMEDEE